MLDGIFEAWDYDGNGSLTLEDCSRCLLCSEQNGLTLSFERFVCKEILPFYMKSSKTNDVLEPQACPVFQDKAIPYHTMITRILKEQPSRDAPTAAGPGPLGL